MHFFEVYMESFVSDFHCSGLVRTDGISLVMADIAVGSFVRKRECELSVVADAVTAYGSYLLIIIDKYM